MPTMKVTTDAAMRARDVSRPHTEHLAWAERAGGAEAPEEAEAAAAGVAAAGGGSVEGIVPVETDAVVVAVNAIEAGVAIEIDVVIEATAAEVTAVADGPLTDGPRRRRVRGVRSSSRRGRPSR